MLRPMPSGPPTRQCCVCGQWLWPKYRTTVTAHEYSCYKQQPLLTPAHHFNTFLDLLAWEKRSIRAKESWNKRKRGY